MKIFWSFTRQAFQNTAIYRFDYWLQLISVFLMMYSVHWIWTSLYSQHPAAFGVNLAQMVTYGILGMALEAILNPNQGPQTYIATQLKTGGIDTDLAKPLDFHLHMLAKNCGEILFRLGTLVLPAALIGGAFLGLKLPASPVAAGLFVVSLALGYVVLFSLNFLLGMVAIITLDIRSISWAYSSLVRFFSGQMVPLWLFPGFLGTLANVLPFRSIYAIPISIYIGKLSGVAALEALIFQSIWVVALTIGGRLAWTGVYTRLVVQGG